MSLSRIIAVAAFALVSINLTSCGTGPAHATNPTVAEMDRLDVQWGLSPRRSRGAPRRTYQYQAPASGYSAPRTSEALPPARETISAPPPANVAPTPELDPATINSLR